MDPNSGTPIIILKDVNSEMMLPIWVGAYEANAIALEIEKIAPQRPTTHDLLRNLLLELGATVRRIVITELRDNTFFAVIEMVKGGGEKVTLDSRPSDAIALALRVDSPIFVNEAVMSSSHAARSEEGIEAEENDEWPDLIGDAGDLPM
ncbi:MAG: bifunctional nuclease family protein [Acidobacteria bacterium]|nr:bifunctional nuclease family protein [Acidobacteriota bacterium]